MISPAVMFIEMAADSMKAGAEGGITPPEWLRQSQRKELHSFGDVRAQKLGASGVSPDFQIGYELGMQTARACLSFNVAAVTAKVDI